MQQFRDELAILRDANGKEKLGIPETRGAGEGSVGRNITHKHKLDHDRREKKQHDGKDPWKITQKGGATFAPRS